MTTQPPEGWWQASDGKWYPPEKQPGIAPNPSPPRGAAPNPTQLERFTSLPPEQAIGVLLQALDSGGAQITMTAGRDVTAGLPFTISLRPHDNGSWVSVQVKGADSAP